MHDDNSRPTPKQVAILRKFGFPEWLIASYDRSKAFEVIAEAIRTRNEIYGGTESVRDQQGNNLEVVDKN